MGNLILFLVLSYPLFSFTSVELDPQSYRLILLALAVLAVLFLFPVFRKLEKKYPVSLRLPFIGRQLQVGLLQDRRYRPKRLTLVVKNRSRRDTDIQPPVIMFRKLLSVRKFKLKGIDRYEIYPLYLEAGKTHELKINLGVFHGYDSSLKKYYWARILVRDKKGRTYSTRYVTLRKSLFS